MGAGSHWSHVSNNDRFVPLFSTDRGKRDTQQELFNEQFYHMKRRGMEKKNNRSLSSLSYFHSRSLSEYFLDWCSSILNTAGNMWHKQSANLQDIPTLPRT